MSATNRSNLATRVHVYTHKTRVCAHFTNSRTFCVHPVVHGDVRPALLVAEPRYEYYAPTGADIDPWVRYRTLQRQSGEKLPEHANLGAFVRYLFPQLLSDGGQKRVNLEFDGR